MPIVLITLIVGVVVGYWLCRMQLRGKFILAKEEMDHAVSARLNAEWMATHPPTQTQTQEQPLSVLWDLPISKNTPNGFSAKQVLGYNVFGYRREPQYPGGIREWDANVNGIYSEEGEL